MVAAGEEGRRDLPSPSPVFHSSSSAREEGEQRVTFLLLFYRGNFWILAAKSVPTNGGKGKEASKADVSAYTRLLPPLLYSGF